MTMNILSVSVHNTQNIQTNFSLVSRKYESCLVKNNYYMYNKILTNEDIFFCFVLFKHTF